MSALHFTDFDPERKPDMVPLGFDKSAQPSSILDCPNETGTWLADNMADEVETAAIEAIGDFLTSFRDGYAKEKLLRQMLELADLCELAIQADEMGRAA